MKILEKLFQKSALVEQLKKDDLAERHDARTACLKRIDSLKAELKALPVADVAQHEKAVVDAMWALEVARRHYAEVVGKLSQRQHEIEREIKREEHTLRELTPIAVHAVIEKLTERVRTGGLMTSEQAGRVQALFSELSALFCVIDEDALLSRLSVIETDIEAL